MIKYRIINWDVYQHYKDRNPPWIKLYRDFLSSKTWVMLDDKSRILVIASMLIAARNNNGGEFDGDPMYFKKIAFLSDVPNFKPLIDIGFLEIIEQDDKQDNNLSKDHEEMKEMIVDDKVEKLKKQKSITENKTNQTNQKETIIEIFDHWRDIMGHNNAKLDLNRKTRIKKALDLGYTKEQLKSAIDGCKATEWYMGKNENGHVYDDISIIFKDAKNIEKFIDNFKNHKIGVKNHGTGYINNAQAKTRAIIDDAISAVNEERNSNKTIVCIDDSNLGR